MGEGTPGIAYRYAQAGLTLGVIVGVFAFVLARDATPLFRLLGFDPKLIPHAQSFLAAATFGAPAVGIVQALIQHRQGLGDAKTPMVVGIAGNVVNLGLGITLIYGKLGFPAFGVAGAGYATAITEWLMAAAFLCIFARDVRRGRGSKGLPAFGTALKEVTALGLPTGLHMGCEMLAFVTFTSLLGSISATEFAAHHAALATVRCSFLPGFAVAEAASVLVGQSLGRKDFPAAERAVRAALLVVITFMAACGVIFAVLGGPLAGAMTPSSETAEIAKHLLWIAAVFQVLDGANMVFRCSLRGAKDVKWPAFLGITIVWTCVPGAAFVLGKLAGWGAVGGWCGFIAETTVAAFLFGRRWFRGEWRALHTAPVEQVEEEVLAEAAAE